MSLKQKLKYLDPFYYVDVLLAIVHPVKGKKTLTHEIVDGIVYLFFAALFAWIIYSALGLAFGTTAPIVIVTSGSMEPVMFRGDLYFVSGVTAAQVIAPEINLPDLDLVNNRFEDLAVFQGNSIIIEGQEFNFSERGSGDIIIYDTEMVYFNELVYKQIIHRVILKIKTNDGYFLITKGDNNGLNVDQDCFDSDNNGKMDYCISQFAVSDERIVGKAGFGVPLIGYVKLFVFDDLLRIISGQPIEEI
ncbi:MAG: hypothetical protein ABH821_06395 [archaeon]